MQRLTEMLFPGKPKFFRDQAAHLIFICFAAFLAAMLLPEVYVVIALATLSGVTGAILGWSKQFDQFGRQKIREDERRKTISDEDQIPPYHDFLVLYFVGVMAWIILVPFVVLGAILRLYILSMNLF